MTFIRVVTGVRQHFDVRFTEWLMGFTLIWWGLRVAGANEAWSASGAWDGMLYWAPENCWGYLSILLGALRLVALTINGTFSDTLYSRYSPLVRAGTASLSCVMWFMVFMSVSAVPTSGGGIYHLPLVLEIWCMRNAWKDTGRTRAGKANIGRLS